MFKTTILNIYKKRQCASLPRVLQSKLHMTCTSYYPRFSSVQPDNELINEPNNRNKTRTNDETEAWDEVEREMYHQKKSPYLKVPIADFKQLRRERESQLFNMKKIDYETRTGSNETPFKKKFKNKSTLTPPEVVQDPEIGEYLKLKRDDPLIDDIFMNISSKKQQERKHLLVLEGRRLIQDAIKVGLKMNFLIFSKIEQVKLLADDLKNKPPTAKLLKVANHNLKFWSAVTTAPGVMGIFERPFDMNSLIERTRPQPLPLSIICDNIREPNNLGAIIRVAAAAGLDQVILTKGCTSPWDMKALRGAAGTSFRVKIIGPVDWEQVTGFFPHGVELFIADNKLFPYNSTAYDSLEFKSADDIPKAVIIGGESHGISVEAQNLMLKNLKDGQGGGVINIPLTNGVESLNVAAATAILLFEMRRKLILNDPSLVTEQEEE